MGWIISLAIIVATVINKNNVDSMMIAAGLFAIAGAVSHVANNVKKD